MTQPLAEVVVDASVAVKLLIAEADSTWALSLARSDATLVAPELLLSESGNALWKLTRRGLLTQAAEAGLYESLEALPLQIIPCGAILHVAALRLANALGHPVYDCLYLALALDRGAGLATADQRFVRVLRAAGLLPQDRLLTPPS